MDPNATLERIRAVIQRWNNEDTDWCDMLIEITEDFDALDGWLKNGGFLPTEWQDAHQDVI